MPYLMIYFTNRFHRWALVTRQAVVARAVATEALTQPDRSAQTTQADTVNVKEVFAVTYSEDRPRDDCLGILIWERAPPNVLQAGPTRMFYSKKAGSWEISHKQSTTPPDGCGKATKGGQILIRMVSGRAQWCDKRQAARVAPEGLKMGKKHNPAEACAELAHRLEIQAAKIVQQNQLQRYQVSAGTRRRQPLR